jgi:predicted acetyltransferase
MTRAGLTTAVRLEPVTADSWAAVENLAQLERHDMSEFLGYLPSDDGSFDIPWLDDVLSAPENTADLIRVGDRLVGYCLTRPLDGGGRSIVSFFVVRARRRSGLGHAAALQLLRRHGGRWGIAFQESNAGAARFWREVAESVAPGAWVEERRASRDEERVESWIFLEAGAPG